MREKSDINSKTKSLLELMDQQMEIKARSLEKAVRRAGRQFPRNVRAQAALLVEAEKMAQNPKLALRLDGDETLDGAYNCVVEYLDSVDWARQRFTRAINLVAGMAFNILLLIGLIVAFLWWRGLV